MDAKELKNTDDYIRILKESGDHITACLQLTFAVGIHPAPDHHITAGL